MAAQESGNQKKKKKEKEISPGPTRKRNLDVEENQSCIVAFVVLLKCCFAFVALESETIRVYFRFDFNKRSRRGC